MATEGLQPKLIDNWPDYFRWNYDRDRYLALSGIRIKDQNETLTFRFAMTWRDRLRALFFGDVYVSLMTFGDPVQPLRVEVSEPDFVGETREVLAEMEKEWR